MIEDGRISRGKGNLVSVGLPPRQSGRPLSAIVQELRREETD
jgi:hypothetical protein